MSALAYAAPRLDVPGGAGTALSELLAATADRHPARIAFRDQPGRERWCGRPAMVVSYRVATALVDRLARVLAGLGLPAAAPVGIVLPNGSEAPLTLLAAERAGLTPCLLPVCLGEAALAAAAETVGVQALVTLSRLGELRPAEAACRIAARYYGIRFVCAFGPEVPDGVIDLDRAILDGAAAGEVRLPGEASGGLVTLTRAGGSSGAVFRTTGSLVAAAAAYLVASPQRAGDRILSVLAQDDLRGLATGLVASLLSGATLETHGLFSGTDLAKALADPVPTHLCVPAFLEPALAEARLPRTVASVVLVHEAPARFKARTPIERPVVDALGFDELALAAQRRAPGGAFALSFENGADGSAPDLLRARLDPGGGIEFAGPAAEIHDFRRGAVESRAGPEWRPSGYRADLFAGIVIGVS